MCSMMTMDIPACNRTWAAHNANCQDLGRAAVSSADTAKWDEGSFREAVETAGFNIWKQRVRGKRDHAESEWFSKCMFIPSLVALLGTKHYKAMPQVPRENSKKTDVKKPEFDKFITQPVWPILVLSKKLILCGWADRAIHGRKDGLSHVVSSYQAGNIAPPNHMLYEALLITRSLRRLA